MSEKSKKQPVTAGKSVEQLNEEMRKLKEQKLKAVQDRVSNFIEELRTEGFGLDATVEISRYGCKPNIFVVEIQTQHQG